MAFPHHLGDLFQLVFPLLGVVGTELRKVQFSLALVYMVGQPPGYGLHLIIPGIAGAVAVAVVASLGQYGLNVSRNRVNGLYMLPRPLGGLTTGPSAAPNQFAVPSCDSSDPARYS